MPRLFIRKFRRSRLAVLDWQTHHVGTPGSGVRCGIREARFLTRGLRKAELAPPGTPIT
jgi:hypothetical protein